MKKFTKLFFNTLKISVLVTGAFFSFIQPITAQDSKGTEFWICFPGNVGAPESQLSLFITAEQNSTVTINIPGTGFNQVVNVTAGSLQMVPLATAVQVQSEFIPDNKGIHITATTEVTVYGMNARNASTDAFLAFPLDALGTDHYVLAYNKDFENALPTQATIVATQSNTTVTITTTVTGGGFTQGVPRSITLQQGQVYQLRSVNPNADYTGTRVVSDKPVSVYGGAQCTNISGTLRACDHLVEQLPPLNSWGRSFLTVPLATRLAGDVFRFLAQRNGTTVSVNGVVVANLNAGQSHERILASTTYNRITSNEPILVGQYSRSSQADNVTSDPFFALVPPDEQFLNNYIVSAGTSNIPINFINITSPTSNIGTVRVDNVVVSAGLWSVIPGTSFSGAKVPVSVGVHRVTSALPIGTLVYGFGSFDSYGYLGGQSFSPVATVASLVLTPETGTASIGSEQCFEALVKDQFNNPVAGVRVDFSITGVNAGSTGFANTNSSGIARFCFTGANTGTDNIVASVGSISDASSFIWTSLPIADVYYSKASGDLHNVLTWGVNPDGSGANPPDFGAGKTFNLANRTPLYTLTGNWTVGGIIVNPAGSQLQVNGFTLSEANLTGAGTITGSPTSNLIVTGDAAHTINFTAGFKTLNTLTLNRSNLASVVSLGSGDPLNLLSVLAVSTGTLNTNNSLTLKSSASNTARVAPILSTGSIQGNVTVERYIPARRAWRLLSAPIGDAPGAPPANLTNAQENPPVVPTTSTGQPRPASFGTATFTLNNAQTAMRFTATVSNIDFTGSQTPDPNDNLTAAHIHASPTVTPTTNGPVVWGFFGAPFNDNNPNDIVMTPFSSGVGGTISGKWDLNEGNNTTLAAQLPNLLAGRAYINFHTTQFGGGEVRGAVNVVPNTFQSINQAWQEGATTFSPNPNPNPGYGTHITQSANNGADGLDFNTAIAMSSLKMHDNATNTWVPVLNTHTTPVNSNAWFTFVRGDRSIMMGYSTVPPNNTVLRSMGPLKTGNQTFPIAAMGLTAIPNPYASPLNFASIAANNPNIDNSFTVVDPKLGTTGAFVNVSFNGVSYDVTPAAASPISELIQSGQGFLVQSKGAAGNIVIRESDKSSTSATDVFRVASNSSTGIRINLQSAGDQSELLDEVFSSYNNDFSNNVDHMDALKATNPEENLAIVAEDKILMVDRRKPVGKNDVIRLKLWNTQNRNYVLSIKPANLPSGLYSAILKDHYLNTTIPIDLSDGVDVPFSINADAASKNPYRFEIAFSDPKALFTPITGLGEFKVTPNPVVNKSLSIQLTNQMKGTYNVELIDNAGRAVYRNRVVHQGGSGRHSLLLGGNVLKGVYKLKISQEKTAKTIQVLID